MLTHPSSGATATCADNDDNDKNHNNDNDHNNDDNDDQPLYRTTVHDEWQDTGGFIIMDLSIEWRMHERKGGHRELLGDAVQERDRLLAGLLVDLLSVAD